MPDQGWYKKSSGQSDCPEVVYLARRKADSGRSAGLESMLSGRGSGVYFVPVPMDPYDI